VTAEAMFLELAGEMQLRAATIDAT